MSTSNYRVRRATLDDLNQLTALWKAMHLPEDDLGKRITEFQVAEDGEGKLAGAVGMQIAERQGRVHSESFADFALADILRSQLWERLQSVATNHGLLRLWTQEKAPFWGQCGLVSATDESMEKLPLLWRGQTGSWLTLKLKDDLESVISLDKEFALFMDSEKQRTARAFQHARALKTVATLLAVALAIFVFAAALYILPKFLHH